MTDEQQVLALREQGLSYRDVMKATGLSRGRVGRIIKAHKDAPSLAEPGTETEANQGSPVPAPASSATGAGSPSFDADHYRNLIDTFATELRARLEGEPSKQLRSQIEASLATFETVTRQVLRTVEIQRARQERERAARPANLRSGIAREKQEIVKLEELVRERQKEVRDTPGYDHFAKRVLAGTEHRLEAARSRLHQLQQQLAKAEAA